MTFISILACLAVLFAVGFFFFAVLFEIAMWIAPRVSRVLRFGNRTKLSTL